MIDYVRLQFGDMCWQVRRDAAPLLFDAAGLSLPNWIRSGRAEVVKHGPHRTVYRVALDGCRTVYVKHYRVADARALVSQWARASRGRREWEQARAAADAAVPTMVPLALGEQRRGHLVLENYLVTEAIEGAEPLDRFVEETLPRLAPVRAARVRRQLAEGLADLVARLHEAGILHADLHAGNVLVRLEPGDAVRLFLIDLHAARSCRRAGWRRSRGNLLSLGIYFLNAARGLDRARFLRRYIKLRPALGLDWRRTAAPLHRALVQRAGVFWRRRDARCVANNRRFVYANIGHAHGFAISELGRGMLEVLLRDPDAPFRTSVELLKDSCSSIVARLSMRVAGLPHPVVYKRFNCAKWLDPVRAMLHYSPALRAWRAGHGLLLRGIATPRPLAIVERTSGPLVRENYLVTQVVPEALSLDQYLREVIAALPAGSRRHRIRQLAGQLGRLVRKMHDRNISHRDMKAVNFLITPAAPAATALDVYLIDLDGVQIWRRLPAFRRLQNLARMLVSLQSYSEVSRSDLLRFLSAYLPGGLQGRTGWKALWRQLSRRATQKIARNRKLSRPIT